MAKNEIIIKGKTAYVALYNNLGHLAARTLIDAVSVKKVSQYRWFRDSKGYVTTHLPRPSRKLLPLHQFIFGDTYIDHINRNRLDNRLKNLRKSSSRLNQRNRGAQKNSSTGIKGVFYNEERGKWIAHLFMRPSLKKNKRFDTQAEAIMQRKKWEKEYFL